MEDFTVKESTLKEVRDSAGSSHRVESIFIRPSAELETLVELGATNINLPKNRENQHTRRKSLKSKKNTRRLRCRRNLVNSFDLTSNETFEVSVAPAIDINDDQDENQHTRRMNLKSRKNARSLRCRPNLVSSFDLTSNETFEVSVAPAVDVNGVSG
nr:hypothetical transcript [Hymenolepis microstoma]